MATKNPAAAQSDAQQIGAQSTAVTADQAATAVLAADRPLTLGTVVNVVVAEGVVLINNETRTPFVPGVPTPQTVTPTLIRRRDDGDLTIVS